ncbi:MAG: hypothetical protein ABR905_03735 [Terracidiphilus sp.]|jgi:hypothetical protein
MKRSFPRIVRLALVITYALSLPSQGQNPKGGIRKPELPGFLSHGSFEVRYVLFAGQTAPSKEFRLVLDHQAKWDNSGVSDPSGSHLRFVMIQNQAAGSPTRYRVFAEGAPENKVYSLQTWLVNNSTAIDPRDLYVNGQGLVMVHRPRPEEETSFTAPGDELEIQSGPTVAEPMRYLLSSLDGELLVYGTLIAHPLLANDQGCRLEARLAQPNEATILIVANGFPAKTKISLVLRSGEAVTSDSEVTNSDGHAVWAVSPIVPGTTQGILKASAEGPNCMPSFVLPWNAATDAVPKTSDR